MATTSVVEKEVKQLTEFIKKLGILNESNQYVVTFVALFDNDDVQSTFGAIVGTLKAAKRRKVINFKGRYLLQGTHDHRKITLLKDMDIKTEKESKESQNIRNDLMKLPMQKLKRKCKAMKLSSEGYKTDMINRIIAALQQDPRKHHHLVTSSFAYSSSMQWNYLKEAPLDKMIECIGETFVFNKKSILHSDHILAYLKENSD